MVFLKSAGGAGYKTGNLGRYKARPISDPFNVIISYLDWCPSCETDRKPRGRPAAPEQSRPSSAS